MPRQAQYPGGPYLVISSTRQAQYPGGPYLILSGSSGVSGEVAETASAADTPGRTAIYPASVAESGSAAETPDASAAGRVVLSWARLQLPENARRVVVSWARLQYAVAGAHFVNEQGAAQDTVTAGFARQASVAEAWVVADSDSGNVVGYAVARSEAANAVDLSDAAVNTAPGNAVVGPMVETAAAIDTGAAIGTFPVSVSEIGDPAIGAVDTTSGPYTTPASIAEATPQALDTLAHGSQPSGAVAEVASAQETSSVVDPLLASIAELASALDSAAEYRPVVPVLPPVGGGPRVRRSDDSRPSSRRPTVEV